MSILSAGTFIGALCAGSLADSLGRRYSIMLSCFIFAAGVPMQTASTSVGLLVGGRVIAGLGVGGVSAIVILYVSEISPKRIRGTLVSGYQFALTMGLLIASSVNQGTHSCGNYSSYRIPIALQLVWTFILASGLFLLPGSPRWLVKKGRLQDARAALTCVRGQPAGFESEYIEAELAEIHANYEYELAIASDSWLNPFKGGFKPSGNLRRVLVETSLQMFQQWTGVNFICKWCAPGALKGS